MVSGICQTGVSPQIPKGTIKRMSTLREDAAVVEEQLELEGNSRVTRTKILIVLLIA